MRYGRKVHKQNRRRVREYGIGLNDISPLWIDVRTLSKTFIWWIYMSWNRHAEVTSAGSMNFRVSRRRNCTYIHHRESVGLFQIQYSRFVWNFQSPVSQAMASTVWKNLNHFLQLVDACRLGLELYRYIMETWKSGATEKHPASFVHVAAGWRDQTWAIGCTSARYYATLDPSAIE